MLRNWYVIIEAPSQAGARSLLARSNFYVEVTQIDTNHFVAMVQAHRVMVHRLTHPTNSEGLAHSHITMYREQSFERWYTQEIGYCDNCDLGCNNTYALGLRIFCANCIDEVIQCANCGIGEVAENMTTVEGRNGGILCQTCITSRCSTCHTCNRILWNNEFQDNSDSCRQCGSPNKMKQTTSTALNPFTRRIGVEIEFLHHGDEDYQYDLGEWGNQHEDGSVHRVDDDDDDEESAYGAEFASYPYYGDSLFAMVDSVTNYLELEGCWINRTCGLHIHLDVCDLNSNERNNITKAWCAFENVFFRYVDGQRRHNNYCMSNVQHGFNDRYRALNVQALSKHGTFEVRLHQGTLDAKEIKNWISFLLHFFETFRHIDNLADVRYRRIRKRVIVLFQMVKMPLSLKKHIIRTLRRQNGDSYLRSTTTRSLSTGIAVTPEIEEVYQAYWVERNTNNV